MLLSELVGVAVTSGGEKIGSLSDLVVVDKDKAAEVTHVVVERPFGRTALTVPWAQVRELSAERAVLDVARPETYAQPLPGAHVLLKDYVLDKKVIDVAEREVEVVYDIRLVRRGSALYAVEMEISRYALLRRMGLRWLGDLLYRSAERPSARPRAWGAAVERRERRRAVPWSYVQPLPGDLGSFKGDLRLKVLKDQLAKLPSVDVADILEELDPDQRLAVFHELETGPASDALEELNPRFQRDVVASLKKEKAALLLAEMTPGQAADVLAVLPMAEVEPLLRLLDPAFAAKIRSILSEQEARIADFVSPAFLRFAPDTTVVQARAVLQRTVRRHDRDAVMYLYVLDAQDRLLGVAALSELLLSDDATELRAIMRGDAVVLAAEDSMKEAARRFKRYGFRALPVVDSAGRMLGILPHRDLANLRQRDLG